MPDTPNLAITHVDPAQSNKTATLNEGFDELDEAIAGLTTKVCTAGGTITLVTAEWRNMVLKLTGTPAAGFNIVVPDGPKLYIVVNSSGKTATVKTAAGTGIAVPTANIQVLYADGTNVIAINTASVAGAVTLAGEVTGPSGSNKVASIARLVETPLDDGTVTVNTTLDFSVNSFHKITTATDALAYQLSTVGVSNGQVVEIRSCITGALTTGPVFTTSSGAIKWTGASAPVSSVASGNVDVFRLKFDGTNWIEIGRSMGCS